MVFSAYISTGQIMGWGNKAIEIRAAETGHLDGVFMHKKAQKLKFLCERNDKVSVWSMNSISSWMRIHTELEQITGFHTNSCLGCQDCAFGEILLFIPLNRFINQQLGGGLWLLFPIILCKEIFNCVWYMYSSFCHFQVFFSSMRSGSSCQIYFMTLNKPGLANWWRILTAMEIF